MKEQKIGRRLPASSNPRDLIYHAKPYTFSKLLAAHALLILITSQSYENKRKGLLCPSIKKSKAHHEDHYLIYVVCHF